MRCAAFILALILGQPAVAACSSLSFEGGSYTACEAKAEHDLRLFLNGPNGPYGDFAAVDAELAKSDEKLAFAMNAGMFHEDLSPVGLYVENGEELAPLVTSDGPGNFGLLPNGVFCIGQRFSVIESRKFAKRRPSCRYATQSGPMLVINGSLHPAFRPTSDSLNIRNGVGVSGDGQTAWFIISNGVVNFDSFARLFRDRFGTQDALYFDGSVSRLYAPELDRSGTGFDVGPIVGLVVKKAVE
jgi:uncharacterized protein YigE (DUF2233 family)